MSDPRYQGYLARWYTYFNSDSYISKLAVSKVHITHTLTSIWTTFTFLNLLIPILSITRGKQIFQMLSKVTATSKPRVYRATAVSVILFNIVYILSMIISHIKGYPTVLECHPSTARHPCRIPPTATSYNYVLGILITKVVILPVAMLTELVVAAYIARVSLPADYRLTQLNKIFTLLVRVFVTWQLLVFIQITVGLITIPLLVLTFVSPAHVLLATGGIFLLFTLIVLVLATITLPNKRKFQLKGLLQSCCYTAEVLFIAVLVGSAFSTYYIIVKHGMNMDGVKGYIMSLIPTILISIFIWIIKSKYVGQRLNKKRKQIASEQKELPVKRRESLSTIDEMINLLSTSDSSDNEKD